jgi:hypothetical protein
MAPAPKSRENELGAVRCPLCGGTAHARLSANQLPYLAMDCCKGQLFARGDHSDTLIRNLVAAGPPGDPAPGPAIKPATLPAPQPKPAPVPPAPATAKPGFLSW